MVINFLYSKFKHLNRIVYTYLALELKFNDFFTFKNFFILFIFVSLSFYL